jgi:hypothetical protein
LILAALIFFSLSLSLDDNDDIRRPLKTNEEAGETRLFLSLSHDHIYRNFMGSGSDDLMYKTYTANAADSQCLPVEPENSIRF